MTERIFEIEEDVDLRVLYGVNNVNIRTVKDLVPQVKLVARGRTIKLSGEERDVETLVENLETLVDIAMKTNALDEKQVPESLSMQTTTAR